MLPQVNALDCYELSPMQQGMLYHTLEGGRSGVYSIVVSYRLHGPLDTSAFIDSWQNVIDRHPILRTSFHWRERHEPVQMVHPRAVVRVHQEDWCALDANEQQQRLGEFLDAENKRGFDLATPPLMRLALIRCGEETHEFVLTHHHLLMDGSCKPLLFHDVFRQYEALRAGAPVDLPEPRPYREYIDWLREQDLPAAERFWREELDGFTTPTPLWSAAPSSVDRDGEEYREHRAYLDPAASEELRQFAKRHRLTLSTMVMAMWALLLARISGQTTVVFGGTANGRPPIDGSESMLGLFINTLPVRVTLPPNEPVLRWLQAIQSRQAAARDYGFAPLSQIQRWSAVSGGRPLFESIVVFENNAGYGTGTERYGDLEIRDVRPVIRNSLPLTLRCLPDRRLSVHLLYETKRFPAETIRSAGEELLALLTELPRAAEATVGQLADRLRQWNDKRRESSAAAFETSAIDRLRAIRRRGPQLRTTVHDS